MDFGAPNFEKHLLYFMFTIGEDHNPISRGLSTSNFEDSHIERMPRTSSPICFSNDMPRS